MRRLGLLLTVAALTLAVAAPVQARRAGPSIVEAAIAVNQSSGEFDHLIAAVVRTGLSGTLDGNRQFTVFAPTDAAFEALFADLGVTGVDQIPTATLTSVLLHHVAPGRRDSGSVLSTDRVRMLDQSFTRPAIVGGTPTIDGATIVQPDIAVANGVIHVIDEVLLP